MENKELPVGWCEADLADFVPHPRSDIVDGPFGSNLKASEYKCSGTPIIRIQNIDRNRFIEKNVNFITDEKAKQLDRHNFRPLDIVITKLGAPLGKAAIVPASFGPGVIVADVVRCRVDEQYANSRYITFAINGSPTAEQLASQTKGTTRPRVNLKHIRSLRLPMAPRDEQDRIVEKIETLFAELDKGEEGLREVQKLLARYRQSVLKAAITGELTADWRSGNGQKPWRDTTLGELSSFLTSGSRGWAKYYAEEGDTFIRAQNLKHDRLDLDDVAFVCLPNRSEGTRTKVNVGDILITITGANVTKTALVERIEGIAYVSQHVALFRPTSDVHPEFLHRFLVAKAGGRMTLEKAAYGAGKPGLNLQNIKDVPISLPPIDEQREIIDRLDHLLGTQSAIKADIGRQLARGQSLRQSILKDAFAGKLVRQHPSDEPADKLLERIRAARSQKSNLKMALA